MLFPSNLGEYIYSLRRMSCTKKYVYRDGVICIVFGCCLSCTLPSLHLVFCGFWHYISGKCSLYFISDFSCLKRCNLHPFLHTYMGRNICCTCTCARTLPARIRMQEHCLHINVQEHFLMYTYMHVPEHFLHVHVFRSTSCTYTCSGTLPARTHV